MGDYDDWIGRERVVEDRLTPRLVEELRVTLGPLVAPGGVPVGAQWCLAPDMLPASELGRDGHPRPGIYTPQLPLPRRMWAGGLLEFATPFEVDDLVTRRTRIADVQFKEGRSGPLGFVAVEHRYEAGGVLRLSERHDIVYREDPVPGQAALPPQAEPWEVLKSWRVTPDATMLFRYSAISFNGHRIHYDHPYATGVEGYDGLVVHGPLQSVWMQNLAADLLGRLPARFSYRGLSPLTVGHEVAIEARAAEAGLALRVRRLSDNVVTMRAEAV